jgi:hypothetical protein
VLHIADDNSLSFVIIFKFEKRIKIFYRSIHCVIYRFIIPVVFANYSFTVLFVIDTILLLMSSSSESDPILVSYHDSIVRLSNLKTLDNSNWLDDNIITFAFEYLQYESNFTKNSNLFVFVTPPVVQLLKMSDDLFAEQLLQSIDFLDKTFLILPLNDNRRVTVFGGSHWSLLILSIQGILLT